MIQSIPTLGRIWYYEANDGDACRVEPLLSAHFPNQEVKRFADYSSISGALAEALNDNAYPWALISDSVGVIESKDQHGQLPPARIVHRDFPLMSFYLFSNAVYLRGDPIDQWKRQRLIATDHRKSEEKALLDDLKRWRERWTRPAIARFRDYILHECQDSDARYFPCSLYDEPLSLFDLHNEMVWGTPLGIEQEEIWGRRLSVDEQTLALPSLT